MALEAVINGERQSKGRKRGRTLRFELKLAPPTEDITNEFSYVELVENAREKTLSPKPDGDPIEKDPENQLTALARKLEEKYVSVKGDGCAPSPKKRRKRVFEPDLIDRGYGYDTSDSFVDDSEMYEDFVPPQVDTQFGGFYVNTGELEFKSMWGLNDDDADFEMRKRKKPKVKKQPSHHTPQSILASQKLKKAKQHVAAHKAPKPKAAKALLKTPSLTSGLVTSSPSFAKAAPKKPTIKKPRETTVKLPILGAPGTPLSLSATAPEGSGGSQHSVIIGAGSLSVPALKSVHGEATGEQVSEGGGFLPAKKGGEGQDSPKPPPVLPDSLPEAILTKIKLFEESVARDQAGAPEGKMSHKARCSYDDQLAEFELACTKLSMKRRTAILDYVSHKLGVSRATTVKRIRQVLRKREEKALALPLQMLTEAVEASMPEQIELYEQEVRARAESMSSGEKLAVEEENPMEDVFEESTNQVGESKDGVKAKRAPRKKYKWTEETRRLVCEVVRVKVESEEVMRGRANAEETLMEFLDTKVKPIWPKGWMQKGVLYKVTEAVHKHFTNPQSKRASLAGKKDKEKTTKELPIGAPPPSSSSSSSPSIIHNVSALKGAESLAPQVILPHTITSPSISTPPASSEKKDKERVQWTVTGTGIQKNGSPVTILTKTITSASAGEDVMDASPQITPRMAQLLSSSAAMSQTKLSKGVSTTAGSTKSLSLNKSPPSTKSDKPMFTLRSDVLALLAQVQSGSLPSVSAAQSLSTAVSSPLQSRILLATSSDSQSKASPPAKTTTVSVATSVPVPQRSVASPLKSVTSPLKSVPSPQKSIASSLKSTPPQLKPVVSPPKSAVSQVKAVSTQSKLTTMHPKPAASHLKTTMLSKGKGLMLSSAGPAIKLSKLQQASTAAGIGRTVSKPHTIQANTHVPQKSGASFSSSPTPYQVGKPHVIMQTTKKVSPSKSAAVEGTPILPSSQTQQFFTSSKQTHSSATTPSPSPSSNSSSPSSSSSTSRPHSPSLLRRVPSPQVGQSSFAHTTSISTTANSTTPPVTGSHLYASGSLTTAPMTTILVPQTALTSVMPTPASSQPVNPRKSGNKHTHKPASISLSSQSLAPITVTTLPFSSYASTLILTSPTPPQTAHPISSSVPSQISTHNLPPHSLTISPSLVPTAGAQVLVAGTSGTGIKSPVEQIYQEHSYGGLLVSNPTTATQTGAQKTGLPVSESSSTETPVRFPPQ